MVAITSLNNCIQKSIDSYPEGPLNWINEEGIVCPINKKGGPEPMPMRLPAQVEPSDSVNSTDTCIVHNVETCSDDERGRTLERIFMAGVQNPNFEDILKSIKDISRPRPASMRPRDEDTRGRALFVGRSSMFISATSELIMFSLRLMLDIDGGLDVMESLETRYMSKSQESVNKLKQRAHMLQSSIESVCSKACGSSFLQLSREVSHIQNIQSKGELESIVNRMWYHSYVKKSSRKVTQFLRIYEDLNLYIVKDALDILDKYDEQVTMMKDRVRNNPIFEEVYSRTERV